MLTVLAYKAGNGCCITSLAAPLAWEGGPDVHDILWGEVEVTWGCTWLVPTLKGQGVHQISVFAPIKLALADDIIQQPPHQSCKGMSLWGNFIAITQVAIQEVQ
eukprot:scaffold199385_cov18-Tisochrysis_lutea.AAC.1